VFDKCLVYHIAHTHAALLLHRKLEVEGKKGVSRGVRIGDDVGMQLKETGLEGAASGRGGQSDGPLIILLPEPIVYVGT
jgi:hypothetical protein